MTTVAGRRAPLVTLAVAAVAWAGALMQMDGMDMGYATELGSPGVFAAMWVPMMAAMMLPGATRAAARRHGDAARFVASYLLVWTAVGVAVYAVYRPHGALAAGLVTLAAGLYELTPFKRRCRERCREDLDSGLSFGAHCAGSSLGLMAMFVALGVLSVAWMVVVAVIAAAQKLLPPTPAIDVPVALALVALGLIVAV